MAKAAPQHRPHITIDARMAYASGIGRYIRALVPLIVEARQQWHFTLLMQKEDIYQPFWGEGSVDQRVVSAPIYSLAQQYELLRVIPRDTDLLWCPHYDIPVLWPGRLLTTVHDVAHLALPEIVGGLRSVYARLMFWAVRQKSARILTESEFSRKEITRFTGIPRDRIICTPLGVDADWRNVTAPLHPGANPYIVYVGNVKPHKNLKTLLIAMCAIRHSFPHRLVIIGKRNGFLTEDVSLQPLIDDLADRVTFTGYLDEPALRSTVAAADCLVLPSIYEGFGLPPLEAMACGVPVAVSRAASLPEVCGEAAVYFDPHDPIDMANAIARLISDRTLHARLAYEGRIRADLFSWSHCAHQTLQVIDALMPGHS